MSKDKEVKPKVLVSHKTAVPKKVTLKVGTLMIDGQDGGYTMYVYPSYKSAKAERDKNVRDDNEEDMTDEMVEEAGQDEYQYGYLGEDEIVLNVDDKGKITLAKTLSFHAGQ